tara:strand:- start:285 stop:854 length:570 start_codon:yes stop_codon:yes gene_type:complete
MRVLLFLSFFSSFSIASELSLDQNFKPGDKISSETFNTIFSTIEKIYSVVKDSDLIGSWICSGRGSSLNSSSYNNWISDGKPSWYSQSSTSNVTLTFISSGASTSFDTPYAYTQSEPILQFTGYPQGGINYPSNLNGSYVLINNELILLITFSGLSSDITSTVTYEVSLLSPTRISLKNRFRTVSCDKQ